MNKCTKESYKCFANRSVAYPKWKKILLRMVICDSEWTIWKILEKNEMYFPKSEANYISNVERGGGTSLESEKGLLRLNFH